MRDRLVELIKHDNCISPATCSSKCKYVDLDDCHSERLADYLLANGVIVPPVGVGQKVWYIKGGYYNSVNKHPCEIEITEVNNKWHGKTLEWGFVANSTRYKFSSIGKTVFITKEEAEQALKGGEG